MIKALCSLQVCVLKTCLHPPGEDDLGSDEAAVVSMVTEEPWICPQHACLVCTAPQPSALAMAVTADGAGPSHTKAAAGKGPWAAHGKQRGVKSHKSLRACSSCPMAMCSDCEGQLGAGAALLLSTEHTDKPVFRTRSSLAILDVDTSQVKALRIAYVSES